jgi:hypothetical protein
VSARYYKCVNKGDSKWIRYCRQGTEVDFDTERGHEGCTIIASSKIEIDQGAFHNGQHITINKWGNCGWNTEHINRKDLETEVFLLNI